jgi:hypothetical protein
VGVREVAFHLKELLPGRCDLVDDVSPGLIGALGALLGIGGALGASLSTAGDTVLRFSLHRLSSGHIGAGVADSGRL